MTRPARIIRIASVLALYLVPTTSLAAQTPESASLPPSPPHASAGARWSGGFINARGTGGPLFVLQVGRHTAGRDWLVQVSILGMDDMLTSGLDPGVIELAVLRGFRRDTGRAWQRVAIGPARTERTFHAGETPKTGIGVAARADLGADIGPFAFGLHVVAGLAAFHSYAGAGLSFSIGSTSFDRSR